MSLDVPMDTVPIMDNVALESESAAADSDGAGEE